MKLQTNTLLALYRVLEFAGNARRLTLMDVIELFEVVERRRADSSTASR